ncbi:hypothetical protein QTP88_020208 [Uroleucon formosanum]
MAPRKRSDMWNRFTELEDSRAKCGYCSNSYIIADGSFGNLRRHLKTVHPPVIISKAVVTSNESHVDDPADHGSPVETSIVPGTTSVKSSQPTQTQSNIMHFMQNKKLMAVSRSKQIDEQRSRFGPVTIRSTSVVRNPTESYTLSVTVRSDQISTGRCTIQTAAFTRFLVEIA